MSAAGQGKTPKSLPSPSHFRHRPESPAPPFFCAACALLSRHRPAKTGGANGTVRRLHMLAQSAGEQGYEFGDLGLAIAFV